ncbi:MAG: hypothetical protein ACEY3D_07465 [Rickettsia sp.]|uniref:hypothetical protein n=1 Tax=Rickettsia sp. TaxID=789 RepID=UPI00397AFEAA
MKFIHTNLAELSTSQVAETNNATGMEENKVTSKIGGSIAKNTKTVLENKTGKQVSSTENYLPPKLTK